MPSPTINVIDGRPQGWFWLPNSGKELIRDRLGKKEQPIALAVYAALAYLASTNRDSGHTGFKATRKEVAEEAGIGPKTLDTYSDKLIELGLLKKVKHRRKDGLNLPNQWILLGGESDDPTPVGTPHPGEPDDPRVGSSDDPPLEEETSSQKNKKRAAVKVAGKLVTDAEYELAGKIIDAFNEAASSSYGLDTWLKRIVGRIRLMPHLTADQHRAIIRANFRSPWWQDEPGNRPGPNVLYGSDEAFERAIENGRAARAAAGKGKKPRGRLARELAGEGEVA